MGEQRQSIASDVYEYMRKRPNEALYGSAVANDLGRNVGSTLTALARFAQMPDVNIQRVMGPDGPVRGMYIWSTNGAGPIQKDPAKPTKAIYEYVGTIRDGSVIVQSESGQLYKMTEL